MIIPDETKIGGHYIPVIFANSIGLSNAGEYCEYHQIIRIRRENDVREDIEAEAYMHEIHEAINSMNDLKIEHTALTVLSEMLFQVIRDNNLDFRETRTKIGDISGSHVGG